MFGWFSSKKREKRNHRRVEARARRFLKIYLNADEHRKPQFYRAVEDASKHCRLVGSGLPPPELEDTQIAEATSEAAMEMVVAREKRLAKDKNGRVADFVTDAYATVAVAYRRAAGKYTNDKDLEQLGTAAVHLLTMATSYMTAQKE
jgi:hypothetical protein